MRGQAPLHAAAWRCPVWRAPPRFARRCLRTHKQRCAAERTGLRSGGQAASQNGASANDPTAHNEQPGEPARAPRSDDTAAFPVTRPGAVESGQGGSPAAPNRRGSDGGGGGGGGGGSSARALSAERRSLGAAASTSGRDAEAGSNGGAGAGSQGTSSRNSSRRGLPALLDARGGPGRPALTPRSGAGAGGAARRPPLRVPPGPPQTPLPDSQGRKSQGRGPLGWLAGLRARLRGGAAAAPRVDAVSLDFRRGGAAGAAVDPFAPQPAPPAPRPAPDLGTIWGLVVLGIAYVHHSTTGCERRPRHRAALACFESALALPALRLA